MILGLLCLLLSDLSSLRGLGPVGAIGIAGAMLSALTLLPAALLLLGRWAYWPFRPMFGSEHRDAQGIWGEVARLVGRRARTVWVVTFARCSRRCAAFVPTLNENPVPQTDTFLTQVDSVKAQDVLDAHFKSDESSPVDPDRPAGRPAGSRSRRSRRTPGSPAAASATCPPGRRPGPRRRRPRWSTGTSWCSPR